MISQLDEVPSGWEKIKFGEIARNITDRIDNPEETSLEDYIGLKHLDTDEIRIKRYGSPDEVKATKFLCKKGDIVFGKRRAYLRKLAVSDREAVVSAHSMVLRPKKESVVSDFLPWFMHSSQFWKTAFAISEGSLSPTIKWKTLSAQEFWLPNRNEQRKIAAVLWSIESSIEKIENLIQVAEKLKKELLEKLLGEGIGHKKFKRSELGEIPVEWEIKTLGAVAEIKGRIGWRGLKSEEYTKKGPYLIAAKHIIDSQIKWDICDHLSKFRYDESHEIQLKEGDTILSKDGTIGRVGFISKLPGEATINSTMMLLRPDPEVFVPKFVFIYLQSESFQNLVQERLLGSTIAHIFQRDMKELKIPIIPKNEQSKIITFVEKVTDVLAKMKKVREDSSRLRKKLADSLLSGDMRVPKDVSR